MFTIVHDVRQFCKMELLGSIYASQVNIKTLMEESAGEAERREAMLKMYHGLKVSFYPHEAQSTNRDHNSRILKYFSKNFRTPSK